MSWYTYREKYDDNGKEHYRKKMRRRIYEIIEVSKKNDRASLIYDISMLVTITVSILPLTFKETNSFFTVTDIITSVIFIIDYILRFATADYKLGKGPVLSYIQYPFTPWAIVDFLSILPFFAMVSESFTVIKLLRVLRVLRVFKAFRYSRNLTIAIKVIKNSSNALIAVCTLAIGYILISALVIFNVEGDSFSSFFEAVYWATVSLTTVGYGDIYPVTTAGRMITMLSSIFGIAIIALPSGIITAGYMRALSQTEKDDDVEDSDV